MNARALVGRVQYVTMGAWISVELRKEQAQRLRRLRACDGGKAFLSRLIRSGTAQIGGFERGAL